MSYILNTKFLPPGYNMYCKLGMESRAYYRMDPYPFYGFTTWKTEELGPYPRCLPLVHSIINRSAIWLFGKQIKLGFPANEEIEKDFLRHWQLNNMDTRLVPMAKTGGQEGAIAIKFSYDGANKDKPLRFQILSNINQVKFFYDPHDAEELLMVRIQYPYQDFNDGNWYWYREEWTKEYEVHYKPIIISKYGMMNSTLRLNLADPWYPDVDTKVPWEETQRLPNKFRVIPIVKIKNQSDGTEFGIGDVFGLTRTIDRINLTYHLMDKSNQLEIDPRIAYIDLVPEDQDSADMPTNPGGAISMKTREPEEEGQPNPTQGKIQLLESNGVIREHLNIYANELKQQLFDAVGAVFPRQEHITNKGSLTQSVLIQMFAPLLEVIGEKRKNYGPNGICKLYQTVVYALGNLGIEPYNKLKVSSLVDEQLTVNITWFSQFMQSEDEKLSQVDRYNREVDAGFVLPRSAIVAISEMEEISLTDEQLTELEGKVNERLSQQAKQLAESAKPKQPTEPGGQPRTQTRGPDVKDAT
jgi:hypothetical protein